MRHKVNAVQQANREILAKFALANESGELSDIAVCGVGPKMNVMTAFTEHFPIPLLSAVSMLDYRVKKFALNREK